MQARPCSGTVYSSSSSSRRNGQTGRKTYSSKIGGDGQEAAAPKADSGFAVALLAMCWKLSRPASPTHEPTMDM